MGKSNKKKRKKSDRSEKQNTNNNQEERERVRLQFRCFGWSCKSARNLTLHRALRCFPFPTHGGESGERETEHLGEERVTELGDSER